MTPAENILISSAALPVAARAIRSADLAAIEE